MNRQQPEIPRGGDLLSPMEESLHASGMMKQFHFHGQPGLGCSSEPQTLQHWFCGVAGSAQQYGLIEQLSAGNRSAKIDCTCSEGESKFLQQESGIFEAKHPLSLFKMLLQAQIKPHSILPDKSILVCWRQQCWVLVAAAAQLWW